eukprot:1602499-Pyramimonas_sp.AAC.2
MESGVDYLADHGPPSRMATVGSVDNDVSMDNTIVVLSPVPGDVWELGAEYPVRFTCVGGFDTVT